MLILGLPKSNYCTLSQNYLLILNNQVKIEIAMHKSVLNCSLTPTQGKYSFDPVSNNNDLKITHIINFLNPTPYDITSPYLLPPIQMLGEQAAILGCWQD